MTKTFCLIVLVAAIGHFPNAVCAALGDELHKLLASDGAEGDNFGQSAAISGSTAIVGASRNDDNGTDGGAAYLYDVVTSHEIAKLLPTDGAEGDFFGRSVAISGSVAIVGAVDDLPDSTDIGAAYLFDVTLGQQIAKLLANDGAAGDRFGSSVAISGNIAIVGARFRADNGASSGAAYLFDVTTGNQIAKLLPDDGDERDQFGFSVGISGEMAIVGAPFHYGGGSTRGAAYVFDITSGIQIAKFLASDSTSVVAEEGAESILRADLFGFSVGIHGDSAVVGAPWHDHDGVNRGAAYLFDVATGQEIAELLAGDGSAQDSFGGTVAINGNTAVVGAVGRDDNGINSGAAYLFDVATGSQVAKLLASDGAEGDLIGSSVAISGNTVIAGAYRDDDNGVDSGSAYVFDATRVPEPSALNLTALAGCLLLLKSRPKRTTTIHVAAD